jgi:hypothetical protein
MSGRCSLAKAALELLAPDFTPKEAAARITQAIHDDDRFPLYCNGEVVKAHIAAIAKVVPKLEEDGRWTVDIESTGPGLGWARGAYNWELEDDAVLALKPQPDTRAEAAQATAMSAMQMAETAAAEAASARAEAEKAWAEAQAAKERAEAAEQQAEAAEARAEATPPPQPHPTPEPPSEIDRIMEASPRPRGGAPLKYKWHDINAEIARRCHDPKTGLVRICKSQRKLAEDMLEWCQTTYNEEPAESVMREAVGAMYAALRSLQK